MWQVVMGSSFTMLCKLVTMCSWSCGWTNALVAASPPLPTTTSALVALSLNSHQTQHRSRLLWLRSIAVTNLKSGSFQEALWTRVRKYRRRPFAKCAKRQASRLSFWVLWASERQPSLSMAHQTSTLEPFCLTSRPTSQSKMFVRSSWRNGFLLRRSLTMRQTLCQSTPSTQLPLPTLRRYKGRWKLSKTDRQAARLCKST